MKRIVYVMDSRKLCQDCGKWLTNVTAYPCECCSLVIEDDDDEQMYCDTEQPLEDPFSQVDPLQTSSDSGDDDPKEKCSNLDYEPSLNLKVYKIPSYNNSLTIYPTTPNSLPKFVNNPLNLANPLSLTGLIKPQNRFSLPSLGKHQSPILSKSLCDPNVTPVRYKKNGEVAKKRGPPKGYKRKPKTVTDPTAAAIQNLTKNIILQAQNNILTSLLASTSGLLDKKDALDPKNLELLNKSTSLLEKAGFLNKNNGLLQKTSVHLKTGILQKTGLLPKTDVEKTNGKQTNGLLQNGLLDKDIAKLLPPDINISPQLTIVSQIKVPEGVELVELNLDPSDWFPNEPYKMVFSKKKNPKWKDFPFRCEHCFKGYRVASTLIAHCSTRHGSVPQQLAIPCPCCPHVSNRRRLHNAHLHTHATSRGRLFCIYCLPIEDPNEPITKIAEKYSHKKFPQYWYASEESLRLHKKRKHPYAGLFNTNWNCTWGDGMPNS